jgi:hypothetical protein
VEELARENNITIEFIRKSDIRKESIIAQRLKQQKDKNKIN